MFHVKHSGPDQIGPVGLFSDAEIAENHIKNVFDVDAAGQPCKRSSCQAEFLGQQILGQWPSQNAAKRGHGLFKGKAMTLAGDQSGFRGTK